MPVKSNKNFERMTFFYFVVLVVLILIQFIQSTGDNALNAVSIIVLALIIFSLLMLIRNWLKLNMALNQLNKSAIKLSEGKLNIDDLIVDRSNGMDTLMNAFNALKNNFLGFIELTKVNMIVLSNAVGTLSESVDVTQNGSEQIAVSMGSISEKSQEQVQLVSETRNGIAQISDRIDVISKKIDAMERYLERTVATADQGTTNLNAFYEKLSDLSKNLDNTYLFTGELSDEIKKISAITESVVRISEQLKLLGLNAAIEAAKSGEFGKGFTVVANEIRALSQQTMGSIAKINDIVNQVNGKSNAVNDSIEQFIESFREGAGFFDNVKESFTTIHGNSRELAKDMSVIDSEVVKIHGLAKDTQSRGEQLFLASDRISASTVDVAAVTEEELAQFDVIRDYTRSLENMLSNTKKLVRRFNTTINPVMERPSRKYRIAVVSLKQHDFWDSIRQGAVYAKQELEELGAKVDFFGVEVDGDISFDIRYTEQLRECLRSQYDGLIIPGFMEGTLVEALKSVPSRIPVLAFNCDFQNKGLRKAVFLPNVSAAGKLAGEMMAEALNGTGKILLAHGPLDNPIHGDRRNAFLASIKKVKGLQVVKEVLTSDDANEVCRDVSKYMQNNKDLQGLFLTGGGVDGAARAVEEQGLSGKVKVVGYDHGPEIFKYIQKGIIHGAIGQDPFGQGHDPVVFMYNYLVTGDMPAEMNWTRLDVVNGDNVDSLLSL